MFRVTLICVGGLKEKFWKDACAEYIKRLQPWAKVSVQEIDEERLSGNPSEAQIAAALETEAQKIRAALPKNVPVAALCIEGEELSSEAFARLLSKSMNAGGSVAFLIGGSHGLSPSLKDSAEYRLSFSPMTFPHMLARVLLFEQLYRGLSILGGGKYHK